MKDLFRRYPLAAYFVLSFLFMWSLASLAVFRFFAISDFPFLYVLGAWTPTLAAVFVTVVAFGSKSTAHLLRGWLIYKVPIPYYACAFLPLLLTFAAGLVYSMIVKGHALSLDPQISFFSAIELLLFNAILGPTGEEAGWRGLALRYLQKKCQPIVATLILGSIWSVWHLPMWFMPDRPEGQIPFWLYIIDTISTSVFLTWIFNSTKGSLLLVGLLHLSQNLTTDMIDAFHFMPIEIGYVTIVIIDSVLALILLVFWGKKNLSVDKKIERKYPL